MKVAIIAFYVMDSELPLIKQLPSQGCDVSLYSLLPSGDQNAFLFNFFQNPQPIGFVRDEVLDKVLGKRIKNYISNISSKVFIYPNRWFQKLFFIDVYYAYLFYRSIKKNKYDVIHLMHTARRFWLLFFFFLDKKKVFQSLHEVTSHEAKTSFIDKLIIKLLIKYRTPLIFHSEISMRRFINFNKDLYPHKPLQNNITMIRFGLFETYGLFETAHLKRDESKIYITNIGRIVPYKGLHLLVDAIKILQKRYPVHLVIAGGGTANFSFEGVESYEFINNPLPSGDMVAIIQQSDIIVLPYTSGSQSGIPMTVFLFNKPIVASDIESFKEIIDDHLTGLLFRNRDVQSLADRIESLIVNPQLRMLLSENIKKKFTDGEFSWEEIAKKTFAFYKENCRT